MTPKEANVTGKGTGGVTAGLFGGPTVGAGSIFGGGRNAFGGSGLSAITGKNDKPVGSIFAQMNAKMEASGSSDPTEDKALSNFLARSAENAKNDSGIKNSMSLKRRGDEVGLSSREDVESEVAPAHNVHSVASNNTGDGSGSSSIFNDAGASRSIFGQFGASALDRRGRNIFGVQADSANLAEANNVSDAISTETAAAGTINPFAALGDRN